jgi:serine/threonine protein phosphatase PrpC/LysM repeat protein
MLETSIISDKGLQATQNQDYVVEIATSQGHLWIVADGEGDKGVKASRMMADLVRQYVEDNLANNSLELLRRALVYTNEILHKQLLLAEGIVAIQDKQQLHIAVFGKSKALKMYHKRLEDIQSSNGILGQQASLQPQIASVKTEIGSQILMMTKGAFLQLNHEDITQILVSHKKSEAKIQELLQKTFQHGGQYNASMALVEYTSAPLTESVGKAWKSFRPYVAPLIFVSILFTFFAIAHFTQRNQQEEANEEQLKIQREQQAIQRRKDSLERLDAKKDTIIDHKVEKGETIGIVARKYNTTVEALMSLNILDEKANVAKGQVIKVNVKMIYVLDQDQTLENLYKEKFFRWEKMGVTVESIKKANKPTNLDGKLKKGTKIVIPALKKEK